MDTRRLGMEFFMINVMRRKLVQQRTLGYELHPGQLPLLETLLHQPDSTQKELAETLRITPASVAQSVARLQRAGLLEKRVDAHNRRCNRLRATPAGERAARAYRQSFDQVNDETFGGLTQEEQVVLSGLLKKILAGLGVDGNEGFWPMECKKEDSCID